MTFAITLRDYQQDIERGVYAAWQSGHRNVLVESATGSGKTATFSKILSDWTTPAIAIAHRQELVSQIAMTLSRYHVPHRIFAPTPLIREIVSLQIRDAGRSYYNVNAPTSVAGVDTLIRIDPSTMPYFQRIGLWVMDEAHHVLKANKWGLATRMFPNAYGLGVSATPGRADGRGLGSHNDGVFDTLIHGPSMRELIQRGYLTDYRLVVAPSDLDLSGIEISEATGDYVQPKMREAVHKSRITGDVVDWYLKIARGKLGITFAVDIESAGEIAQRFRQAGVPAEVVTGKTPLSARISILKRFERKEILQLVNVDLFGEGFDLPAIEVVSMARPTASLPWFLQACGRGLRPMPGKGKAILIDHVGNWLRHKLPNTPRVWTLEPREKRSRASLGDIPMTYCLECSQPYEKIHKACPYCGTVPVIADVARSSIETVDGDPYELDPAILAAMRGEISRIDGPAYPPAGASHIVAAAVNNRHYERQLAQAKLRQTIAWWAGYQQYLKRPDSESHKRFFYIFGVDTMTAQALGTADANALTDKIHRALAIDGIGINV